jgi:UDP-glucose 4-epimerase
MKKVVVFGGSGFLGRYMVRRLLKEGIYDVYSFDKNFTTLLPSNRVIVGNIFNRQDVSLAVKGASIVFNYAAISDIEECIVEPVRAVEANILGNTIILDECAKSGVERFILASSVYADCNVGGVYRSTKAAAESLVRDYQKYYGIKYTILRYGTIYGPGADDRNSVYRFLKQALAGKIEYHGNSDARREYIHAADAANLTIKAMSPEYENRCMILTGERSFRVSCLLTMIKEILGTPVTIEYDRKENKNLVDSHYQTTPYTYDSAVPKKMVLSEYIDVGLGLIDCLKEIDEKGGKDDRSNKH